MTPRFAPPTRAAFLVRVAAAACLLGTTTPAPTAAASQWGRSPRITKKMQEEMAYMQLEVARVQEQIVARQLAIQRTFDENGDGVLKGPEKARFDRHMHAIRKGTEPNPFSTIMPVGTGPRPRSCVEELKLKMARDRAAVSATQLDLVRSFDANGDGQLTGPEKSRFDKRMHDIATGAVPNPFLPGAAATDDAPAK